MKKITIFVMLILSLVSYANQTRISNDVHVKTIAENIWIHTTYINLPKWGRTLANGLIVITDETLVLIDTPWNDQLTISLVKWFEKNYEFNNINVIGTHHHHDNIGGLNWIHSKGYKSYAIKRTYDLCVEHNYPRPKSIIAENYKFSYKDIPMELYFLGEGHSVDNVSVYLPNQKILFGGCAVKSLGARSLGNTAEANLAEWPKTLINMKQTFPDAEIVIPGHGREGDLSLIDHSLSLFK